MTAIAVVDDWQGVARRSADWTSLEARAEIVFLEQPFADEDAAADALARFDVLLTMRERTRFPRSLVARLERCRMIGITGTRNASLDLDACRDHGITVCHTGEASGAGGFATAELALGLLIAAARGIPLGDAAIRAGSFQAAVPAGIALAGRTLGLIGLGRLGTRMAGYANALGMTVLAWSPNLTPARAADAGVEHAALETLLARADAVSLHLVLSDATRGIIGGAELARMRRGAILVNTSRAGLVDAAALLDAVSEGRIVAALDVFDREPPPPDDPIRSAPGTVLTPHLGYAVAETYGHFYERSVANALAFLDGTPVRVLAAG